VPDIAVTADKAGGLATAMAARLIAAERDSSQS
jgi:hypothetical protein